MVITIGQGTAYVLSGMYGDVRDLGIGNSVLIVLQLFFAGIVVLVLVRHSSSYEVCYKRIVRVSI
jgi:protein transport protein SEC61 subunit alpha